jgi:hypothetical protein
MRKLPFVLTLLAPLLLVTPARAQDWAWVMSIPYALSQEQIYKVRLLDIDGVPQNELIRYAVGPGKHTFTVQMMLDVEWEPDLSDSAPQPPVKQITLEIESERNSTSRTGSRSFTGKIEIPRPNKRPGNAGPGILPVASELDYSSTASSALGRSTSST